MSVAYELDFQPAVQPAVQPARRALSLVPSVPPVPAVPALPSDAPGRARSPRRVEVVPAAVLRPLHDPAPLRLTRRGVVVLTAVLAAIAIGVVLFAAASSRAAGAPSAPAGRGAVTVQSGDTLWSIASRVAPGEDPRAEIATIRRLNDLHGVGLVPGQRLRVH
ncbi:MAG: LysM peptidoglycan-binding domain-containing protein [Jatrophihabitans endophyticus]|nr:LysM peptidoglycan-binding domain-containing protein [Jatrophihabitans endophyticus]